MILAATQDTIQAVYQGSWEGFISWCRERGENPIRAPLKCILDFLLLKSGELAVNTIKGYVMAISRRHVLVSGNPISLNLTLKRWIKVLEHSKGIPCLHLPGV